MNSSGGEKGEMKEPVEKRSRPEPENASLVVGWQQDAGKLGPKVIAYLNRHIRGGSSGDIGPVRFFPLGGVAIDNNIARFPVSRFYAGTGKELVLFESTEPVYERYRFLNSVLDAAEHDFRIKELYTISGTIAPIAHTDPRRLLAVSNQPEFHIKLQDYGLEDMTWEGPPAINSFLLWLAQRRGIPGVSLWPEVAFYLAATQDPGAAKVALSFFDRKFNLGLDLAGLDSEIKDQNERLAILRRDDPQIDRYIRTLEMGITLNEEEQLILGRSVTEFLDKSLS
jgi:predicted ATP-grasp superfamily ATP-dependent carboligase